MKDGINLSDESGDRKYFSMIPHYILNHSSAIDQALYMQMKRFAGESRDGECFVSMKSLKERLQISHRTLKKSLLYLLEHDWIYEKGDKLLLTRGGPQKLMSYGIRDLWKKNLEYYEKGVPECNTLSQKGVPKCNEGIASGNTNKNIYNKNIVPEEQALHNKDISEVIDAFKEINPAYKKWFAHKSQRSAADRLLSSHSKDQIMKVILILPKTNKMPWITSITSPCQLEDRWATLESQLIKEKNKNLSANKTREFV